MNDFSPRERLIRVINHKSVDRPPVVCPGGMMNSAITDIMNISGNTLPSGHRSAELMASIASDVVEHSGFENIGVPFCMTVEAEVFGSGVDFGTLSCEPKITKEIYPSVKNVRYRKIDDMLSEGRISLVSDAVSIL
ncbi:MAG TPA: uroporphyrinogen decarboxylase family protein, partial [Spirochaetota bacterium]|nr:uroporphyrinogen decarboxylase family protein [Spirochaetota bacterium]